MILTMCLNIGIDPEEWREEISKDVPVAREECGLNFWTKDDYELDNRNNDAKQTQYDSIISELQSLYMENIGNQLLRWQKLIQRTANKVCFLIKYHIFSYIDRNEYAKLRKICEMLFQN